MEMLKNLMETITGMGPDCNTAAGDIYFRSGVQNETRCRDQVGHHSRYWFYWFRSGCWFIK